jgi:hypothetical protein
MGLGDLAVLVLKQIGLVAMQNARHAAGQAGGMLVGVHAMAACLDADHLDRGIVEEGVEQADGVRPAAHRRDQQVGQLAGAGQHLGARFLADHALEIADQFGIGCGPAAVPMM